MLQNYGDRERRRIGYETLSKINALIDSDNNITVEQIKQLVEGYKFEKDALTQMVYSASPRNKNKNFRSRSSF